MCSVLAGMSRLATVDHEHRAGHVGSRRLTVIPHGLRGADAGNPFARHRAESVDTRDPAG
jgi:hypothetical protein